MTEVIVMESAAYQKMMGQIAKIAEFITKNEHKLQDCDFDNDVWLDSQEVADMLHISTRTLQRLRSDGLVEYSVFRRKCLYKLSEIEKKVREKVITCEPHLIDKEDILQATDRGLSVFRHYLPVPFRIGKKFLNPLYKDTKASCNVYYDRRHSVYKMKDFGNEEYSGDCFELVGTMTGLSCRNAKDFVEIMRIIDHDLHLGLADGYENCVDTSSVQVVCPPTPEQVIKKIRPYNIVPRAFNETDRIFWSKSRITEHTLNKYNVRPLHSFSSVNQEGKSYTLTETAQEPMYGYVGDKYIKIYRPRSEMRFLYAGDLGDNYCFGLDQLSAKGDLLFITGGEKDVMSLAANGFHAICFNSETTVIPTSVLMLLSYRFKHIVLLYDMDKTGLEVSAKRQEELKPFALKRLLLPLSGTKEEKDVTDQEQKKKRM